MEFHTLFSDGKRQDSAVVLNHMEKLIKKLKKDGVLKDGGYLYSQSDGAASQHRSSSIYALLAQLAYKYKITIDRCISAPGHGEEILLMVSTEQPRAH